MQKPRIRWHIAVFLAPAVLVYTAVMIYPLFNTLRLALFNEVDQARVFVGLQNFRTLFLDPLWSKAFWNALGNNFWFFLIHMLVQNPIGVALAALLSHPRLRFAALYRSAIFVPTILSFVIVGFAWKLILSPIWGIAPEMLDAVGLKSLFAPWLGKEQYALTTLGNQGVRTARVVVERAEARGFTLRLPPSTAPRARRSKRSCVRPWAKRDCAPALDI